MKHLFTFILSGNGDLATIREARIRGRLTITFPAKLTHEQQRARLDALVRALSHAGITAAPKLPEPHQ